MLYDYKVTAFIPSRSFVTDTLLEERIDKKNPGLLSRNALMLLDEVSKDETIVRLYKNHIVFELTLADDDNKKAYIGINDGVASIGLGYVTVSLEEKLPRYDLNLYL